MMIDVFTINALIGFVLVNVGTVLLLLGAAIGLRAVWRPVGNHLYRVGFTAGAAGFFTWVAAIVAVIGMYVLPLIVAGVTTFYVWRGSSLEAIKARNRLRRTRSKEGRRRE